MSGSHSGWVRSTHHIWPFFVPSGSRTSLESLVTVITNGHRRPCDDVMQVQRGCAALRMHAVLIDPVGVLTLHRHSGPVGGLRAGALRGGGGAGGGSASTDAASTGITAIRASAGGGA